MPTRPAHPFTRVLNRQQSPVSNQEATGKQVDGEPRGKIGRADASRRKDLPSRGGHARNRPGRQTAQGHFKILRGHCKLRDERVDFRQPVLPTAIGAARRCDGWTARRTARFLSRFPTAIGRLDRATGPSQCRTSSSRAHEFPGEGAIVQLPCGNGMR